MFCPDKVVNRNHLEEGRRNTYSPEGQSGGVLKMVIHPFYLLALLSERGANWFLFRWSNSVEVAAISALLTRPINCKQMLQAHTEKINKAGQFVPSPAGAMPSSTRLPHVTARVSCRDRAS